jgi:hypothetical protein
LDKGRKILKKKSAARIAAIAAVGGEERGKRSVFIQTVQQSDNDGQRAAAKGVRAENTVFRAEHKQRNQNPKGRITLRKTSHKFETSCVFPAGNM